MNWGFHDNRFPELCSGKSFIFAKAYFSDCIVSSVLIEACRRTTGEEKRSKSLLGFSIKAFLAIGILCYVLIVFFSRGFFTIFNPGDIELINFMESKSLPYFSGFFLAGFNILMISYWQANERTSKALTVSLCRSVIWPPILVAVLPLIFGSEAVWLCHSISEIMTAVIAVVLIVFIKRKKENQKVGF